MFPDTFMMGGWWIPIFGFLMMIFCIAMMLMRRGGFMSDRRGYWRGGSEGKDSESALDILKKRYANGEISKEEFDQIKKDL